MSPPPASASTAYHMSTTVASVCAATCWSRSLLQSRPSSRRRSRHVCVTWRHPNPNFMEQTKGRKNRAFQIDHFLMHGDDMQLVKQCGSAAPWLDSDHGALKLVLRLRTKLAPKRPPNQRAALTLLDRTPLRGAETNGTKVRVAGRVAEAMREKGVGSRQEVGSTVCVCSSGGQRKLVGCTGIRQSQR